jgi:hypothetical protein
MSFNRIATTVRQFPQGRPFKPRIGASDRDFAAEISKNPILFDSFQKQYAIRARHRG